MVVGIIAAGIGFGQLSLACGGSDDVQTGTGPMGTVGAWANTTSVDPTPENMDGVPSDQFESDDIQRANNAPLLIDLYCDGAISEAQRVGCMSHVQVWEVCEQDTDGKIQALIEYEAIVGNRRICG
jgi:hypothetical protein